MSNSLTTNRADEINRLHDEVGQALRTSLEKAMRIGELLTEQKVELPHGEWGEWISAHCLFTDRTARNYMKLHANRDRLLHDGVSDISAAYKILRPVKTETISDSDADDKEWERDSAELYRLGVLLAAPRLDIPTCMYVIDAARGIVHRAQKRASRMGAA